ncbi:MAG TPA: AMP-binding protein, partial [Candidatus Thermoplasmatota archaeon]|nr:AMP-binding protein [Candidatus Thermoplasmatota archaeon]
REQARPGPEDPMFLVYTSGTTGGPKGALLPHRVVEGRMPGFLLAHEPFPEPGALFYSPADWSWIGGLHDSLFAPWCAGSAVLAHERAGPFDPAAAFRLMAEREVTDAFLPPTALKALARGGVDPPGMALRSVHSAGEPLPGPVARWARERLAHEVTEVYGLTECAFLVGTATQAYDAPEGSMGRPYPTHLVAVRDGEVCARRGDPTMMLGYWQGPDQPPRLPLDDEGWLHTGDVAEADAEGYLYYKGRTDDLIKTSGHRVGPAEVEAALLQHPAVAECAVVGVPDPERGQRVKAFVKPSPRVLPSEALAAQLQAFVRARLAAHAYPREVAFVDALPTTVSGKLKRRELRGD